MAQRSQNLLDRIGSGKKKGGSAGSKKKEEANPLLKRISVPGNTQRPATGRSKSEPINPLLAALQSKRPASVRKSKSKVTKPSGPRSTKPITQQAAKLQQQLLSHERTPPLKTPAIGNQNVLKIKNASTPNFLKIKNLEYGTTASDLRRVLESIGDIEIIKVKDLHSGSTMAEVLFKNPKHLEKASKHLHGAIADDRIIEAIITNESEMNILGRDDTAYVGSISSSTSSSVKVTPAQSTSTIASKSRSRPSRSRPSRNNRSLSARLRV